MSFKIKEFFIAGVCIASLFTPVLAITGPSAVSRGGVQKKMSPVSPSDTLSIRYDREGSSPIFISGNIVGNPSVTQALNKIEITARRRALCRSFLSKISHALKIAHPAEELTVLDKKDNAASETAHYKIEQKYRGIRVLGAEATVHLHGDRADFVGRTIATPAIDIVPAFSADRAVDRALSDLHTSGVVVRDLSADEREILDYEKPVVELVVFPSLQTGNLPRLAYQVLIRPNMLDWWEYIVDAHTGEVLFKLNRTCDVGDATATATDLDGNERVIHTYLSDKYYLIDASRPMFDSVKSKIPNKLTGTIVTYDYKNKNPAFAAFNLITSSQNTWDAKAVSAQYNATVAYEYYRATHGRNSIDGEGGTIRSFINVADQMGTSMDNAYWNGQGMYYGNGLSVFKPLPAALDVAGHELTHGVIEATAALRYVGQSGALNESLADLFGCFIERINWTIGETVVRPGIYPSNALRNLANPHNGVAEGKKGWQPQTMAEYQKMPNTTAGDNGGVHINNSIPSYAIYLFSSAVGKEVAERVVYRTLTTYLSASSQFADFRIGSRLACEELYGKESPELTALTAAFDSVGIFDDTQPFEHVEDLAVNPGTEYVLLTAAPPGSDGTTMYIADSAFGSLRGISKRSVMFRPSVSDDGSRILFVSGDKKLVALTLNGTTVTETVIDSAKTWSLCAISRDGLRFAAVHEKKDTAIYIGSMSGGPMEKYNLNGPADDINRAVTGAVNSTALEWNLAGDEVIYDVYNSLAGSGSLGLTFWDIGFLRTWDLASDSFGDGEVSKLFSNLGDGISVGNPTFSKNSPNIIAYECVDNLTYSTTVMSMNMENRKTVTVAMTEFPGYPSYSKRDDRIAFSTITGADTVISVVKVKEDKQTPDGDPEIAIRKMKWAVYFATGTRVLDPTRVRQQAATQSAPVLKPDVTVFSSGGNLRALIVNAAQTPVHVSILRADGRIVHRANIVPATQRYVYSWNGKTAGGASLVRGIYFVRMETGSEFIVKKLLYW